jgi:predicted AlkP superfamily phosphohydrolase/phosphomutase
MLVASVGYRKAESTSGNNGSIRKIMLIGVDGGSWDILYEQMNQGKMPHFKKLVDNGAAGYLDSLMWKSLVQGGKGYLSPIVWATISTGKLPTKHGIEDFTLPLPSELIAAIPASAPTGYATVEIPPLPHDAAQLWVKIKAGNVRPSKFQVYLNQTLIKDLPIETQWRVLDVRLPSSAMKHQNQLSFYFEVKQSGPDKTVAELNFIRIYNQFNQELADLHFMRDRKFFGDGWNLKKPQASALASSFHLRTKTLWDILSDHNRRVGVVGWWQTWPAPKVNGYLVSSHVGYQGSRIRGMKNHWLDKIKYLTYPEDYLQDIKEQLFLPQSLDVDIKNRFYDIDESECVGKNQDSIFRNFYWQDRLFETVSQDLLKNRGPFDLFAVYFRGIDASSHQFLGFGKNTELASKCTEHQAARIKTVVTNYYLYMDEVLGRLQQLGDSNTITIIVTDHGQFAEGFRGIHKNNGFIIMHGPGIKTHLMQKAKVLDIAPTILYLTGLAVPQDMDGSVMLEAIDPEFLAKHPLLFTGTYESLRAQIEKQEIVDEEANKENMEQLKALGYVQ